MSHSISITHSYAERANFVIRENKDLLSFICDLRNTTFNIRWINDSSSYRYNHYFVSSNGSVIARITISDVDNSIMLRDGNDELIGFGYNSNYVVRFKYLWNMEGSVLQQ
jgi:hypothetical protein